MATTERGAVARTLPLIIPSAVDHPSGSGPGLPDQAGVPRRTNELGLGGPVCWARPGRWQAGWSDLHQPPASPAVAVRPSSPVPETPPEVSWFRRRRGLPMRCLMSPSGNDHLRIWRNMLRRATEAVRGRAKVIDLYHGPAGSIVTS